MPSPLFLFANSILPNCSLTLLFSYFANLGSLLFLFANSILPNCKTPHFYFPILLLCQVHVSCLSTPFCQIVNSTLLFPYFVILLSFLFCQVHFSCLPTSFCPIIKSTLLFPYFAILSSLLFCQIHFSHFRILATWTNLFQEMKYINEIFVIFRDFFASFFEIQIIKLATSRLTHSTYVFKLSKFSTRL